MFTDALPEFRADWLLAGEASTTVDFYVSLLHLLGGENTSPDLLQAKAWVGDAVTVPMRRKRAQAVRAFGRWSESIGDGVLLVRSSKTGKPRVVPMPPITVRSVRRHLRGWNESDLFAMTTNGIRLMLRRNNLLSAHAWRRGWAVQSLRIGVSETSVRAAEGWSSGAMVARYTRAMSAELALDEFQRSWHRACC